MQLNQLSISYKCHNSIGNSLKLDEMIKEVLKTFLEETDSIYGGFYLTDLNHNEHIVSVGKRVKYSINDLLKKSNKNKIEILNYNQQLDLILYRLQKGLFILIYDKDIDLNFIVQIYEGLRKRLDISISACLNVRDLQRKNQELNDLTQNLQNEIQKAVELNKKKDKQMFEQMKMAQMGELIGNIAHQWRQPLSVISTVASGMKLKKELNLLKDEDFSHYADKIVENSKFLSKTIDEFRDYIEASHKEKDVVIQDRLKMAINIIEPSCKLENIRLIEDFVEKDDIEFRLISGELLQVLISILNNAKEAFHGKDIDDKWIKYCVIKEKYKTLITIEDNAGGIDNSIKDKIFNPYFTTKHQSQGTGVGLYSSYSIITSHLDGKLYFSNTSNGAKFFIELPIHLSYEI